MRWPFRKTPDAILTDAEALDALLENDDTRAAVLTFIVRAELETSEASPEAIVDLAMAEGLDHDAALLLCALAARLDGAR